MNGRKARIRWIERNVHAVCRVIIEMGCEGDRPREWGKGRQRSRMIPAMPSQ